METKPFSDTMKDNRRKMTELAKSFPSLARAGDIGLEPFDPRRLDAWASTSGAVTSGSLMAAQFVLSVWSGRTDADDWDCGTFDMFRALSVWDSAHRAAFLAWVEAPWYP